MATHDVPGFISANNDTLHDGCWAESGHRLLSVDRIDDKVHFSLYENDGNSLTQGVLPLYEFARAFSGGEWLWHDKSPKPAAIPQLAHVPAAA